MNQYLVSWTGPNFIKLFTAVIYECPYNLECLSLASLSSIFKCLQVRLEPNQVKYFSDAPLSWVGSWPYLKTFDWT
jgi:hypothetical protein